MSQTATVTSQPIALVPENAPFTLEQRGWLNGFFAGLLNGALAGHATTAAGSIAAPPVEAEEDMPWHDPALAMEARLNLAQGKRHPLKLMAAMAQLDCGSCGYICKSYAEAIASGQDKDLSKCTPGGRETSKMLKTLQADAPAPSTRSTKPTTAADATKPAGVFDRSNPFTARLRGAIGLNGTESAKDTRHVVISLRGSGITYRPGDALGVYPENCAEHVQDLLDALGATGAEEVMGWDDQTTSFRDALQRDFTITRPSPDLLDLLARSAKDAVESEALAGLRDGEEGSGDLEIVDLLRHFPSAKPKPSDLVATLSPLAPRLYSISSSQAACPDEVHLTVGTVRYKNSTGRPCKGVASTFLADRVRPGHALRIFVQPSHRFGLPDADKPIIMVGPGTGIAPFRSFLQERHAIKATGKSWLIFGDQTSDQDFLYRDELEHFRREGILSRLDTAFSRDQVDKLYVQHRMIEQATELWRWLQEGAYFYVCGDAKRMASDVDKALRRVAMDAGGLSAEAVDAFMADLARSGRYQRDVY